MIISKVQLQSCIADLPDSVDTEDVMYRLYLMEKIEAGEKAILDGNLLSEEAVEQRIAKKWQS